MIHLELCKKFKFDHSKKMVYAQSVMENETNFSGILSTNGSPNLIDHKKRKKKKTCRIVNFVVPADHRVKLKESKKRDKSLDLARELKKLWKNEVTVIPSVIGALGTVTKGLVQDLEDLEIRVCVETIQNKAFLRSARILTRALETWGYLLSLKRQWETVS